MSTAEHTARVPAGETSPLPTWIADTLRQYDLEHREPGAIEELLALPEVALVAYYRYTRQGQPSPTASRRAATALLTRYGGVVRALSGTAFLPGMDRLVADVGETLPEATTMFQQGWLGFLEAIERYDPTVRGAANRQAGLRTYAGYYIKLRVQEVYVQGMRLPYGHSEGSQ